MSYRFGKQGIYIPTKVFVKITGQTIITAGPKGTLIRTFSDSIKIARFFLKRVDLIKLKDINTVKTADLHDCFTNFTFYDFYKTSPKPYNGCLHERHYNLGKISEPRMFNTCISYFWPVEWIYDSNPWEIYYNVSEPMASCAAKDYWYNEYVSSQFDLQVNNNPQEYEFYNQFGIIQTDTADPVMGVKMLFIQTGKVDMLSSDEEPHVRTFTDKEQFIHLEYSSLTPYPETNLQGARYVKSALWGYKLTAQAVVIRTKEVSQFAYRFRDKISRKDKPLCSIYGTELGHLNNMVTGVFIGFKKILIITGVGYRAQLEDNILILNLGFSHSIKIDIPNEISIVLENSTCFIIFGIQKESVGAFASKIRAVSPPEPYKGKGISYETEIIKRKVGKTGK
uniref:Ribosomal protein L6 n=1 Tax=Karlodinium veneficum TaxID=407301 RepID=G1E789_KARVE|nr:ribosomal protein L6 [Karlodinium veneficum]